MWSGGMNECQYYYNESPISQPSQTETTKSNKQERDYYLPGNLAPRHSTRGKVPYHASFGVPILRTPQIELNDTDLYI
jgi:hypothetical protein